MVERAGKLTKMPINPSSGEPASCADSSTWGTYEQAVERSKRGEADGIGIQLGAGVVVLKVSTGLQGFRREIR
jgi:primase-polymerase (primpol)-like protein